MPKPSQQQLPLSGKGAKGGPPAAAGPKPPDEAPRGLPREPGLDPDTYEEDFTEIDGGFPMAEEGFHHAKVIDFEKSDSKKSGNPQYVWQFRITAGASTGMEIRFWTSLLPQARWKTAETLDALGIQATGSIARFNRADILGRPCIIEVIHDTYDGRLNHKVKKVHPPNEDSVKHAAADNVPF